MTLWYFLYYILNSSHSIQNFGKFLPVKMMLLKTLLVVMSIGVDWTLGARILAVMPMNAKSHQNLIQAVLKALAEGGHQVINYSAFPLDKPVPNYTDVFLDGVETPDKIITPELIKTIMDVSPIRAITMLWDLPNIGQKTLENEQIKSLLKSNEKFDLIILEPLFAQEVLLSFGYKFSAPVIAIQPFGAFSLINKATGNSLSLSSIPDYSFPYSDHMGFYERFLSAYSILSTLWTYYIKYLPAQEQFMKGYFKDPNMPPVVDMIHNISLFVNNAHPTVHYAQPYTPNLVPVGGIHLKNSEQSNLPPKMKKFMDEAKHGVIYFALGSFLPDQRLPQIFFENFIRVFRQLPQRVLWKTRANLTGLSDNIMTGHWMPQQDVLAHPNTQLFMTHGGLFSQHEAINAGVPVVCIPFFGDQPLNAKFYEEKEIGVKLQFKTLSEQSIQSALSTVLNNPKFKNNIQRLSKIYRDQPISPAESLLFWVEYVLRHKGAPHLRPVSSHLSWYQLSLLDVFGSLIALIISVMMAIYLVSHTLIAYFKHTTSTTNVLKKKKK